MTNSLFKNKKRLLTAVVVLLFVLIFISQNIYFILKDTGIKASDNQIRNATVYFRHYCLNQRSSEWIPLNFPYPPLLYVNAFPLFALRGISMESARLSLIIFSIIFLLSMFGIGKEMGDSFSGMAVMALAASSPHFLNLSRAFYTDMPQIAFTALSLYLLIKSNSFSDRLHSVLLGIALGLSFLSKWSTAFFMLFPVLWFYIPAVIKAKCNEARLISAGIPLTLMGSISLFYKLLDINQPIHNWILCYFLVVILSSVLWGLLVYLHDKRQKKDSEYKSSGNYSLINFSLMSLVFFNIASPWYIWAGRSIKHKFLMDMEWQRNIQLNNDLLFTFLKTAFNFAPILVLIGLVFIFIKKENLVRNLIFPLSFLTAFFLMMTIGNPQFRYVFTLLIFLAVIGGFWVRYLGKAKIFVTAGLVMLSMFSILAWTIIPADNFFYSSLRVNSDRQAAWLIPRLFCSEKPDTARHNAGIVIDWIFKGSSTNKKPVILISYFVNEDTPVELEYLYWVAYKKDKDLGPLFVWDVREENDGSPHLVIHGNSYGDFFKSQNFGEILIVHRSSLPQEKMDGILRIVTNVLGALPDSPVEKIDIGGNVSFTCLRYKSGLKILNLPKTKTPTVTPES